MSVIHIRNLYQTEPRADGKAAVIRIGRRGGITTVGVYKNRPTALRVAQYLDAMAREEA